MKFQGGIGNTAGWFESIGIPGFLAYVVGTIELVGNIALILGLGTRIVSALLAVVMIGAILKVETRHRFLRNSRNGRLRTRSCLFGHRSISGGKRKQALVS